MMHPKKSLGQHWLHDEASLSAMLSAGEVTSEDVVLEVGPGLGTLTKKLCETAKNVIAVELDNNLATNLKQNLLGRHPEPVEGSSLQAELDPSTSLRSVQNDNRRHFELDVKSDWTSDQAGNDALRNLEVVNQSILDFDTSKLPEGYKIIANIPYYLTSNLIRKMLENPNPPSIMVLLIQKEVAERVAAKPGSMGILSVATQFYAEVSLKELVPAELFTPPPKVDSQIIQITRRPQPLFPDVDTKQFFTLVRAGFSEKRKKLRSALSGGLQISKTDADILLQNAGLSLDLRAQELDFEQWHALYSAWKK